MRRSWLSMMRLGGAMTVLASTTVLAQPTASQSEPPAPQAVAPVRDDVALAEQIDRQIAERVAKELAKRPATSGWNDGFFIQTADATSRLKIGGFQQFDGRFFVDDDKDARANQFGFRSIRPDLQGTLFEHYDFRLMPDFSGGRVVLQDAYLDVHFTEAARIRVGKFKVGFGLERFQGETHTLFTERGLPTQLAPNRDLGLQIAGELASGTFSYQVGVSNGVVDGGSGDGDVSDGKEGALRIFVRPFARGGELVKELGFGGAVTFGFKRGVLATPDVAVLRTPAQTPFFAFATGPTVADTVIADGATWRATGQAYYYARRLGLLGEYVRVNHAIARGTTSATASFDAWQAAAQLVLTNDVATFKSVTPRRPFDPAKCQWGAVDIGARIGELRVVDSEVFRAGLADGRTSALRVWSAGFGVNWYVTKYIRVAVDFERTWFRYGASDGTTAVDRVPESSVVGRVQTVF